MARTARRSSANSKEPDPAGSTTREGTSVTRTHRGLPWLFDRKRPRRVEACGRCFLDRGPSRLGALLPGGARLRLLRRARLALLPRAARAPGHPRVHVPAVRQGPALLSRKDEKKEDGERQPRRRSGTAYFSGVPPVCTAMVAHSLVDCALVPEGPAQVLMQPSAKATTTLPFASVVASMKSSRLRPPLQPVPWAQIHPRCTGSDVTFTVVHEWPPS